jgi:hypothetical protein
MTKWVNKSAAISSKLLLIVLSLIAIFPSFIGIVYAGATPTPAPSVTTITSFTTGSAACSSSNSSFFDFPTWYKYLPTESITDPTNNKVVVKCSPVLDISSNPALVGKIILAVVEIMLRIGGLAAVFFIVYGGFKFILSRGDPQKAVGARQTIINALIGMVIAAIAVFIVQLIGTTISA